MNVQLNKFFVCCIVSLLLLGVCNLTMAEQMEIEMNMPSSVKVGEKFTVSYEIKGGTPPYKIIGTWWVREDNRPGYGNSYRYEEIDSLSGKGELTITAPAYGDVLEFELHMLYDKNGYQMLLPFYELKLEGALPSVPFELNFAGDKPITTINSNSYEVSIAPGETISINYAIVGGTEPYYGAFLRTKMPFSEYEPYIMPFHINPIGEYYQITNRTSSSGTILITAPQVSDDDDACINIDWHVYDTLERIEQKHLTVYIHSSPENPEDSNTPSEPYAPSVPSDFSGLYVDDGYYYVDGERAMDFTDMIEYNGGQFYIANGKLSTESDGLTLVDDRWLFLSQGQLQSHHSGFALYDGEWFYLEEGKLDLNATGLYEYDGGTFLIAVGRLVSEYTGLAEVPSGWYYVVAGQVQTQYTGYVEWNGGTFYVENGKLVQ